MSCTSKGSLMSQAVFDKAVDIAVRYGCDITIGGGEPTLHPKCIDWVMQAAMATVDQSLENDFPNVLIVTNGSLTEKAIKLAKLAHLGMIQADLSQDIWHDEIDEKVVKEFSRYNHPDRVDRIRLGGSERQKGYAGIRNVEDGVKGQGRAKENDIATDDGCACSTVFIAPNGDFYQCGCRLNKMGNILTTDIDTLANESLFCCECEKYLMTAA